MIFLNPAVLFGLLAAAIPVLLHLLNLRKLKRIEFSTLAFLKELQKNKIRKIKLKQWLLLALRVLIILLLVISFARPTLKGINIGGATSAAKTTAVFIVDNTFSMSETDENGSNFNKARQVIRSLTDEFQEGDNLALIPVADSVQDNITITSSPAEFRENLDKLEISYMSGTLNSAVVKAVKILEESGNFNKEIYVFSDLQKSRLWENLSSRYEEGGLKTDLSEVLNERVKLYFFDQSGRKSFNLGIDSFHVNNQIFEKEKTISFTAAVTNYSNQAVNDYVASLFINGNRSAQQSVSLNPGETQQVTFETILKAAGNIEVVCELEDDDVIYDNKRYLNIYIPEKLMVGLFSDTDTDLRFVKLALSPLIENNNIEMTERNLSQVASVNLENFDAVFVIGSGVSDQTGKLTSYVQNGGGLFVMPGSGSTQENFSRFVKQLHIPEPAALLGSLKMEGESVRNNTQFDKVEFEHPVFSNLFEKSSKKQVESPEVYRYFKINPGGRGKNIISLIDRSSFLSEYKTGNGKILMMNTAPLLEWSDLPLKGIFAPLVDKSVYYLASKEGHTRLFKAGEEAIISLNGNAFPQIKIEKPDNTADIINMDAGTSNYLNYKNTFLSGNYKILSGNKIVNVFSVNAEPLESNMEKLEESEIEDYLAKINFKGSYFSLNSDSDYRNAIRQARFGSELWRHFLILAFVLALLEMFISRSAKKDMVSFQKMAA